MKNPLRWSTLVALSTPVLPGQDALFTEIGQLFPNAPECVPSASSENLRTLSFGEMTAAVTLVKQPIPWSQLEGPAAAAAWYWPEAAETLRPHEAHLLVTLVDEGGSPIEKAIRLSQLSCAAASVTDAVGIFWGPGRLVHKPVDFLNQARQMAVDDLPLFLWVDFRLGQTGGGSVGLFTTGLEALGIEEIEVASFDGQPQELVSHAYNIAHYLLTSSKAVNDGQTIGVSEEQMATISRGPSMIDPAMVVWRLTFDAG